MDWTELKKSNKPLKVCKIIMRDYIKLRGFDELEKKYNVSYNTIKKFLDKYCLEFDGEALSLEKRMRAVAHKNRGNNLKKVNEKKDKQPRPSEKSKIGAARIKIRNLNVLDSLPKIIKYREFLNIISKEDIHTLTTDDWIRAAESKGIKIIGVETPKWLK